MSKCWSLRCAMRVKFGQLLVDEAVVPASDVKNRSDNSDERLGTDLKIVPERIVAIGMGQDVEVEPSGAGRVEMSEFAKREFRIDIWQRGRAGTSVSCRPRSPLPVASISATCKA